MPITVLSNAASLEMIQQTFEFWFVDKHHIRSPFPEYIIPKLKDKSVLKFERWVALLDEKSKEEMEEETLCLRFEEILFEVALELVENEEEKITIQYPFLPRTNDLIYENAKLQTGESKVVSRKLVREGDKHYLQVFLEKINTKELWDTKFELPL